MSERLDAAVAECATQADDAGLWFQPKYATEAYLQGALRKLHAIIEGKTPDECARIALAGGSLPQLRESDIEEIASWIYRLQYNGSSDTPWERVREMAVGAECREIATGLEAVLKVRGYALKRA